MPFNTVRLIPGANADVTRVQNQAGYTTTNLGRFKDRLFQKLGGWLKFNPNVISQTPRSIFGWKDLNGNSRLAIGSQYGLFTVNPLSYVTDPFTNVLVNDPFGDNFYLTPQVSSSITPQVLYTNTTVNISTVSGSNIVTIVDTYVNNITTFDSVYFGTPVSIGGIILSGLYDVSLSLSGNSYKITSLSNATSTVNNSGTLPVFTTSSESPIVSVVFPGHGLSVGSTISLPTATSVGGITINGQYTVQTVTDANTFSIVASSSASSVQTLAMNNGQCSFTYYITLGPASASTGWGIGAWGSGTWGRGAASSAQTGTSITATNWTLDNWGQILLACPKNGGIYYWDPTSGYTMAQMIAPGPVYNSGIFVAMPAQILVAYGSTVTDSIGVQQDPLLVRWSDQLNFLSWTPSATNQAGSFRIPSGSSIIGAAQGPTQALIWTDLSCWAMQYIGYPLVFGFNKIADNCGLIATHAWARLGNAVYWMGGSNFYMSSGSGVSSMPCPIWDVVFQNIDTSNSSKCFAGSNTSFDEVWFFYPSLSNKNGECDSYVKYNTKENCWDFGSLPRTAWMDRGVLGAPLASDPAGYVYYHETGTDADDSGMPYSFTTGFWEIAEGQEYAFVDQVFPDFKWGLYGGAKTASVQITLQSLNNNGDNLRTYGPYTVTNSTPYISTRLRGRYMSMQCSGSDLGSFIRLGAVKYRWAADGRR